MKSILEKNASGVKSSFQLNLLLNHIQTKKVEKLCIYPLLLVNKTDLKQRLLDCESFWSSGFEFSSACLSAYMSIFKPAGLAHYFFLIYQGKL